jgi:hypothetical protein
MVNGLRNHYLQKLGIVQYVGKDLPVVAPAAAPTTGASGTATEIGSSADKQRRSKAELVNVGLGNTPPEETKPTAPSDSVTAPVAPQKERAPAKTEILQPVEDINLQFALWQASEKLLVCSSIDEQLPDPAQILLLDNILLAMGQGGGPLPQMELVEWPPHANMKGDEAEVRGFLATMLKARVDSKGAEQVLLLGDLATHWLLNKEQRGAVSNGQVDIMGQVTALLVPSLQDMMDKPECKRQTWQTIRYLSPMRQVHKADS